MERRNELIRVPFLISFSCFRAKILIERERERGGRRGVAVPIAEFRSSCLFSIARLVA